MHSSKLTTMYPLMFAFLFLFFCNIYCYENNPILYNKINELTFKKGEYTNSKNKSVKRLQCIGGNAEIKSLKISKISCLKKNDNDWECDNPLGDLYQLSDINVICEGYGYPGDAYILDGSCYLQYKLDHTAKFYEKLYNPQRNYDDNGFGYFGLFIIFMALIVIVVCIYVYNRIKTNFMCKKNKTASEQYFNVVIENGHKMSHNQYLNDNDDDIAQLRTRRRTVYDVNKL